MVIADGGFGDPRWITIWDEPHIAPTLYGLDGQDKVAVPKNWMFLPC